ncbi:MAG TPA: hypothetical protein VLF91_06505 [Candidatus Saccharimonadales bacterium]|nr:hypothetical protein [Candidatus Saccharimonadales bacterium]
MNTTRLLDVTIERPVNPAAFYTQNATELNEVGADAFDQPIELFAPQVGERFARAGMAQIMRVGKRIAGFALYDMIRGRHWRLAVN